MNTALAIGDLVAATIFIFVILCAGMGLLAMPFFFCVWRPLRIRQHRRNHRLELGCTDKELRAYHPMGLYWHQQFQLDIRKSPHWYLVGGK